MGVAVFRQTKQHLTRCDFCHKLTHQIYRMALGTLPYNFCSGTCANRARINYEDKVTRGITPNNLEPIEDETDQEEDHIIEPE